MCPVIDISVFYRTCVIPKMLGKGNRHYVLRGVACFCILHVSFSLWCFMVWIPNTSSNNATLARQWLGTSVSQTSRTKHLQEKCDLRGYLNKNMRHCQLVITSGPVDTRNATLDDVHGIAYIQNSNRCGIQYINNKCGDIKYSFLYGKGNITDEEKQVPLAFTIKLHSNPNQAYRLLRFIYRTHNIYCIHVDKKAADSIYEQFKNISGCVDNIIVIDDRVSVVYSTIRQVDAEFRCIDAMLRSHVSWRYYINLTGQEFMLKTNLEIVQILKLLKGRNDIESYTMNYDEHKFKQKTFVVGKRAHISKLRKDPFHRNITIRKGSAYGLFSRAFLEFVKTDKVAQEFIVWLADTYAPEEMIWATLNTLDNAPGGYKREITQKNKYFLSRAVIWSLDHQFTCKGKYVHWVCVYGNGDVPWLLQHRNIVANKFYENFEPMALDCLEATMYERLMSTLGTGQLFSLNQYADVANLSIHVFDKAKDL